MNIFLAVSFRGMRGFTFVRRLCMGPKIFPTATAIQLSLYYLSIQIFHYYSQVSMSCHFEEHVVVKIPSFNPLVPQLAPSRP